MSIVRGSRYVPLIAGEQRNSLIFLQEAGKNEQGQYLVLCRCVCDTPVTIRKSEFGQTKSCGCAQRAAALRVCQLKRHEYGAANRRTVYRRYARFAFKRGLCFDFTLEQFHCVSQKCCFYCGAPPSNREQAPQHFGEYVYSGIDRLNNAVGYTLSNTVPCCIQCNKAKGTLSVVEFKAWLSRAFNHLSP